ncbi:MAG: hypothetical protein QF415_12445 [Candidatus Undinarchaeales archaeon]|nr:hypothetical protein [Candidatus Undinarchaeales archaeon]
MVSSTRTALVLMLMLTLLATAAGNKIERIEEIADVSKTPINDVTVILHNIEQTLFENINKPEVLEAVCSNIKPSYTKKCTPKVDRDRRTITFHLRTIKNLIDVSAGYSPNSLTPKLKLYYVPLNFLIVDEYEDVGTRSIEFQLPTFGFTLEDIKSKKDIAIDFPVQCPDGTIDCWRSVDIPTDKDTYEVGDTVFLNEKVDFALWTIFNMTWGATPLSEIYKCFNCTKMTLPTSYGPFEFDCRRFPSNICPLGEIMVHAIYKKEGDKHLYNASRMVTFKPAEFLVYIYVGKGDGSIAESLFLGETMIVGALALERKVTGCVIKLMRGKQVLYQTKTLPECSMVPIMTDTSWPEGEYVVVAEITNDLGATSAATQKVFLVSPGTDIPVPVSMEKAEYIVGDTVALYINTPGERCVVELVNYTGIAVETLYERAFPCGAIKFEIPESIIPGVYQLRVKVYRGEEYGVHVVTFKINEWIPKSKRGTDLDRLCLDGMLGLRDVDIPCIGPEVLCQPSTDDFPVCLCFRKDGMLTDVCEFNERCLESSCRRESTGVPFVVLEEGGDRYAVTGLQKLPFVTQYEMCPTHCICSDMDASFYHVCGSGEMCTRDDCYTPLLSSRLISFSPDNVRQNDIALGEGKLEATIEVRYEGKTLTAGIDERSVNVVINGREIAPEEIEVKRRDFNWHVTVNLPKDMATHLNPGEKWVWIGVRYKGETTGVRSGFTVWYSVEKAEYNVKVHSLEPSTIAMDEVKHGSFLKMYLGVTDEEGTPVTELTRDDLTITLDGRKVQVFSMRYVPGIRQWVLTVVVRGQVNEGNRVLHVDVNRLGKSGKSADFLSVVGSQKVRVNINDVTPGSRYQPIFQVMERIGFDMDVMVSVKGRDIIPQSVITMDIVDPETNAKIKENLSPLYVSKSQEGYRIHFGGTTEESRLQFCGESVIGWKDMVLTFTEEVDAETGASATHTATGKVLFVRNPGEWKFFGQCEGGVEETTTAPDSGEEETSEDSEESG